MYGVFGKKFAMISMGKVIQEDRGHQVVQDIDCAIPIILDDSLKTQPNLLSLVYRKHDLENSLYGYSLHCSWTVVALNINLVTI